MLHAKFVTYFADLFLFEMGEFLVVQRRGFDFRINEEPYTAIQLFINTQDWSFLDR